MRPSLLFVAAAAAAVADAAYCGGAPSPNAKMNEYPINTQAATLLNQTANGKAYLAGQPGYEFYLLHVYGTAYEMGFAHGSLMAPAVREMANATWQYMLGQVEQAITFLPAWLSALIANEGLDVALDLLIDLTKPFTGAYIYDELRGLAEGAGVDYKTLCRIHLIGELTQGDCSMYGAWGPATAGGKTLSLRALDWDTDGPFKNYPAVIVYHPSKDGHAFANVGFLGWVGALTGMSSSQMSVHEIGVSFPDTTHFGAESFVGIPFVFLLRDVLQFDTSVPQVVDRMTSANRTCDLILGAGDGKPGAAVPFNGFAYSSGMLGVYDDTNLQPWNATNTWHPRIPSMVYWGMDWLCPSFNRALATQLQALHGALTPENTISNVTAIVQTGDLHIAVYDLTDNVMFVSFMEGGSSYASLQLPGADRAVAAAAAPAAYPTLAYDRPFTRLDMAALFAEPPPTLAAAA